MTEYLYALIPVGLLGLWLLGRWRPWDRRSFICDDWADSYLWDAWRAAQKGFVEGRLDSSPSHFGLKTAFQRTAPKIQPRAVEVIALSGPIEVRKTPDDRTVVVNGRTSRPFFGPPFRIQVNTALDTDRQFRVLVHEFQHVIAKFL